MSPKVFRAFIFVASGWGLQNTYERTPQELARRRGWLWFALTSERRLIHTRGTRLLIIAMETSPRIALQHSFIYPTVFMDKSSRNVLPRRPSNAQAGDFYEDAPDLALPRLHPENSNSDHGQLFTSRAFTRCLKETDVVSSMAGRGGAIFKVLFGQLCQSLDNEAVYQAVYYDGEKAGCPLNEHFSFYCGKQGDPVSLPHLPRARYKGLAQKIAFGLNSLFRVTENRPTSPESNP